VDKGLKEKLVEVKKEVAEARKVFQSVGEDMDVVLANGSGNNGNKG